MQIKFETLWLLKNLRGFLYFSKEEFPEEKIKWLKRKFRYRNLGILSTLARKEILQKEPFINIAPEDAIHPNIFQKIKDDLHLTLLCASKFVCGLIIIGEKAQEEIENLIICEKYLKGEISDKELKFNLRLIDYAGIDLAHSLISRIKPLVKSRNLEKIYEIQKEVAVKDFEKRFWRIRDKEGKRFVFYLTTIKFLDKEILKDIEEDEILSMLQIVPALYL